MQNISVIGVGRLGLCWALVLEKAGYNVVGCDIVDEYVRALNEKTFTSSEPHVDEYLCASTNFRATTSLKDAVSHGDIIFVNVRTDSDVTGKYDHSQVDSVIDGLWDLGEQPEAKHLVIATNVNPGCCDALATLLGPLNYSVSFSPEYVPQGRIIEWNENPEMVVIGEASEEMGDELQRVIEAIGKNNAPVFRMDRLSAEISKLALNCYLTMKISYANSIGDLALRAGANAEKILGAIAGDSRIGGKYLSYGFGYGGPCFPRDNKALIHYADTVGASVPLNAAADIVNTEHLAFQTSHFIETVDKDTLVIFDGNSNEFNFNEGKFGSVAYKTGTVILEESQQLFFAIQLAQSGYQVEIRDTAAVINEVKAAYGDLFQYEVQ